MALFFNGIVLSHYNSYNLSRAAHVTSEQIFGTLATITETIVFLYMVCCFKNHLANILFYSVGVQGYVVLFFFIGLVSFVL